MVETVEYFGQPNCRKLSNRTVEVIVTADIGPRVIRYGFPGGDNILGECPEAKVTTDLGDWRPYGGHRLWHAPEAIPRSYVPDDGPVQVETEGELAVRLVQPVEAQTGIEKEMTVTLDASGTQVTVQHKLTNRSLWNVQLAPWGLTIMNGGGAVIIPQEPYLSHDDYLLPARPVVLWHYTDLSDPRFAIGKRYIQLRTDTALGEPQKVGVANKQGWAAYLRKGTLFVKQFGYEDDYIYPDCGCNCETYTAGDFIELETLGPLHDLEPGDAAQHTEIWHLFKGVEAGDTEDSLEAALRPILAAVAGD